ncbi:MOXD1-like protein 1 [Operophtera brumata]|uniref:MOXD1-like protein 1 n=1 Tax=Operophtera brumata TaxID=104452 RepID=A0A0L7L110_OPEBR|nr:MOXD1-like protein 1 [Operophtera brumata]
MVAGIGVSALHVIPPAQKQYKTVGICSSECTEGTMPKDGINIVSVLLHAHGTARKISLKHVRGNKELPRISEENSYDVRYQQSRVVPGGRKFLKGDTLLTECTYDSTSRDKLILGGYSDAQLRSSLKPSASRSSTDSTSCRSFENPPSQTDDGISKRSASEPILQGDDQGVEELVIWEPSEFRNKSFMAHLNEMPWQEPLLTKQIQKSLYYGLHMTFCKKRDDSWGVPIQIQNYPTFKELEQNETSQKSCHYKSMRLPSVTKSAGSYSDTYLCQLVLVLYTLFVAVR